MSDYEVSNMSLEDAQKQLRISRSGGGRGSKYDPIIEDAVEIDKGEVVSTIVNGYNEVQGLRGTLDRKHPETFEVKSTKHEEDKDKENKDARYRVFVFRAEDIE